MHKERETEREGGVERQGERERETDRLCVCACVTFATLQLTFFSPVLPMPRLAPIALDLLLFRQYVRRVASSVRTRGPVLVHCSAGVGRSGTFIVIDRIMKRLEVRGRNG